MSVDEDGFINNIAPKLIISTNKINNFNIHFIFKKYNIPINNMYPSDIESVIIIDNTLNFQRFYDKINKLTNTCKYNIITDYQRAITKKCIHPNPINKYVITDGEIDSDEIEEIEDTDEE